MRLPLLLLLMCGAFLALPPRNAQAQNAPGVPQQLFKKSGNGKDLCLQSTRTPTDVQNRLVPATCMKMGGLQMWRFLPVQGGGYRIINIETGGCLDVEWGANWGGGRILDWPCNNADNQRWEVNYVAQWVKIRGWQSKLCLDIANGIAVQTDCRGFGGDTTEHFQNGPVWYSYSDKWRMPRDDFGMRSMQSNFCMTTDPAPVLGRCKGPTSNDLDINNLDSAATTFQLAQRGGVCLVDAGKLALYGRCSGKDAWRLVQLRPKWGTVPAGVFASRWEIQNVATGRCLTDSTGVLLMGPCNGTVATLWTPVTTTD